MNQFRIPNGPVIGAELAALLRHRLWADAIRLPCSSHFMAHPSPTLKSEKSLASLAGALFYAPA